MVELGTNITYTCSFVYRGRRVQPIVWEGPGVAGAKTFFYTNRSLLQISADCYTGKFQVTQTAYRVGVNNM